MQQKEETFQVVIDTIKKVKDSDSYEFLLANKRCIVDAEVFRKILDICPRVEGEEYTEVQDDDATLTFLIDLGYKGLLHKYTNMYVDHMHQPWRTLAAIVNKCLSGKTENNNKLRKSRIDIPWGMFYRENINYHELIWEDFDFQIDHRKERKLRHKIMPFPRFTKVIISHFLSQHKSLSKLQFQHYHTIKDDGIVIKIKFVRIGEDYQEYGLLIPDMIKVKGSQGKKTADTHVADVDVSEESDSEPARKRTASRRVVKKKVIISAVDNIIPDLDVALELGKSISLTEVAEEEAARKVHATHARIVTESEPEPAKKKTGSRSTRGVVIQDTPSAPKPKPTTLKLKLKGAQSLTPKEQEAADIMQALKESKKTSRRQPGIKGSNKGTGVSPGVLNESTVIPTTSSEGTGTKPGVPDEEKIDSDEDEEKKDDTDDDKSIDLEMTDDEETDDEFVHGVEQVNDDEDEEMTNAEVEESGNGDEENTDAAKTNARKTEEVKDDAKKAKLPPTSSSLSVSSVPPVTTLPPPSVSTIPPLPHQTTTLIPTPPITTKSPTITIAVSESDALTAVQLRVAKLEKDVFELNKIDLSAKAFATLKSQVPNVVDEYLGSKLGDALQKTLQKHSADLIQTHSVKPSPESSKIQTLTVNLEQGS
ncbi:hypothetical protein Tco_0427357 [Tanacetum coccineum]